MIYKFKYCRDEYNLDKWEFCKFEPIEIVLNTLSKYDEKSRPLDKYSSTFIIDKFLQDVGYYCHNLEMYIDMGFDQTEQFHTMYEYHKSEYSSVKKIVRGYLLDKIIN